MTSLGTLIGRGATGSKPAAGTPGALYYDTTLGQLQRDNGSSWDAIEAGGELSGTDLSLTGLTGSTSTFRFVGANASGAPASGAHNTNDVALDIAGKQWYLCTAGGTPGTWSAMGGGGGGSGPAGELGYTQITTSSLTTTSTSLVDVSGVSVTVTIGSRPVVVRAYVSQWSHTSGFDGARALLALVDSTASAVIQQAIIASSADNGNAVEMSIRVNPAAGSRTYKLQFEAIEAGTITLNAGSTQPTYIQVIEV